MIFSKVSVWNGNYYCYQFQSKYIENKRCHKKFTITLTSILIVDWNVSNLKADIFECLPLFHVQINWKFLNKTIKTLKFIVFKIRGGSHVVFKFFPLDFKTALFALQNLKFHSNFSAYLFFVKMTNNPICELILNTQ